MAIRVTMNETGRITIPASIRREMRLEPEQEFELVVAEDGTSLKLQPLMLVRRSDAWFYADEHLARLNEALEDVREGRVVGLDETKLDELLSDQ